MKCCRYWQMLTIYSGFGVRRQVFVSYVLVCRRGIPPFNLFCMFCLGTQLETWFYMCGGVFFFLGGEGVQISDDFYVKLVNVSKWRRFVRLLCENLLLFFICSQGYEGSLLKLTSKPGKSSSVSISVILLKQVMGKTSNNETSGPEVVQGSTTFVSNSHSYLAFRERLCQGRNIRPLTIFCRII